MDRRPNSNLSAGRIALGYSVIAILWIAFSDAAVTHLKLHPLVMTLKGTIFVFVTASLLYLTIRRLVQAVRQTSRERDETEELYRTVVEASNEGMCLLDESGRISFLNERLAAMLGRPAEELQGTRLQDFLEEPQVLAQPGARHSETRECRLRKGSEAKPWVLISRRPVLNDAGEVAGLVVTVADSTEPKWTDKALRRGDAYLAGFSGSQENVGERRLASPVQYGLAILSVGVAVGTGLLLQYFHFHVPGALLLFAVAVSSWYGRLGSAVLAAVLATGSYYYCFVEPVHTIYIIRSEIPFFIIFVSLAALLAWFGVVRRRIEANLRAQADLLNLTHDAIFVTDLEGQIKYWNRGAEERYGWPSEQTVGRVAHDLLRTVFPHPLEHVKAELTGTGYWEGEISHTKKDGTQVVVASRWSLQRDNRGTPVAILETNNDITARKRSEEALHRLNRELRAISNCNQTLLRATDEQSLLQEICRIVCEDAGYRPVWVGYVEHDQAKSVRPVAWAGADEAYLENAKISWSEDTERGRGPTGTAIRSGQTCCVQDFATDPRVAPWRKLLLQGGFRSAISLPLKDEHAKVFGALSMHSERPDAFTPEEIRLLEELAGDLAFGVVALRSRAAREEAEQEVALLSFALNNVFEAAFLVDEHGRFAYVNEEACRALGYTRAELLGMAVPDIDPELPVGLWADHWRERKKHGSQTFESRHRTRDGRIFPVEISANYFEYRGRAYTLALARNITQRKQAEAEVRDIAAQWQATFDAVPDLVLLLDQEFRILRANHAAKEFLGSPSDEIIGGHCYELIHGMSKPPSECPLAKMRRSRKHEESEVLAREGGPWLSVSVDPLFDASGELAQVVHVARDITERKRAEEALRRSEAYLKDAQRLSHTGSWAFDVASNRYVYLSEECSAIFELDAQDGSPEREAVSRLIHREDWDRVNADYEKSVRDKVDTLSEFRITLPSGTTKYIQAIRHPVMNDTGELVELVGTVIDITERKLAEEARRRGEAYLKEAQRLSHTGSWALDVASGRYDYWSEEMFQIYELDASEPLPSLETIVRLAHPEDLAVVKAGIEKSIREKVDSSLEFRLALPSGTVKYVHAVRHPVANDAGEVITLVGALADITERKRAEETLRRTTAYLAEAQRLTHTGAWATDAKPEPLYWSEELFRLYGFEPQDTPPTHDQAIQRVHPEDREKYVRAWQRVIRQKVDSEVEFRTVLPDGAIRYLYGLGHPVLNSRGELVEMVGTTVDITERKRAEEALRRSEAYLTEAQRLTHTGSWAYDPTGGPIYWSEEMFRIYDLDPDQGSPTRARRETRIHPEDLQNTRQARHKMLHEKLDCDFEHRIVLSDGRVRHVHVLGHPVLGTAGEVLGTVGTTVDITERKRAEEALRESETRFRTFVDHTTDAFFMLDLEQGSIVDVNRPACESIGYTREELIGTKPTAFHLDSEQAHMQSVAERVAAGEPVSDRHWHRRKDGSVFPVEVQTSAVSHGGRRFLLKVARDITHQVQAEEQREKLRQIEADLAHIHRVSMMGELTASIAHEVNQPLSGVVSNASACLRWLARDVPDLGEAREALNRIVRDGKRAGEVIKRIRAMTKRSIVAPEQLNLNETIREILVLVSDEAKRSKVTIRTLFADDLSPVSADRVQMQQVLLNLIMNGIEAMSAVDDRLRELVLITRNSGADRVQVTVEDSGTGLDPEVIEKIFDPFYTTKSGGMGMGLSICRSIVQHHGGRLWATINDGPGTSFHFTLSKCQKEE